MRSRKRRKTRYVTWILSLMSSHAFDAALKLVARVTGVPGRAVTSHANDIFLVSENEEGKSVISRVSLKLSGR